MQGVMEEKGKKGRAKNVLRYSAERRFWERMRLAGVKLVPQPRSFELNELCTYTPDFWDPKNDIYYEVIGSRQAREFNWLKIELFKVKYPEIDLRVVKPDGTEWEDRAALRDEELVGWGLEVLGFFARRGITNRRQILGIMRAARKILLSDKKKNKK